MPQTKSFACVVVDHPSEDVFSAEVTVFKRDEIRKSRDGNHIELADIFITPVSGQVFFYGSKANWKKTPGTFNVPTKEKSGSHNHFVLYDYSGRGLYIVRDSWRNEVRRRECSIWDLGHLFALNVTEALKEFT